MKQRLGLAALLLAYLLWLPGITQPMLSLSGHIDKARVMSLGRELIADSPGVLPWVGGIAASLLERIEVEGRLKVYEKTRSIVGTVGELLRGGNWLVAGLVALFAIGVPLLKGGLLLYAGLRPKHGTGIAGKRLSDRISRWSMADVFVVAIVVAYLAANASQKMDEIFSLDARFGIGFYCFLAYCLLSIGASQLMRSSLPGDEVEP